MSFLPGGLELFEEAGEFVVTVKDEVVVRTRSQKAARQKFDTIRRSMEKEFPHRLPSDADVKAILASVLNDVAIAETLKRAPRKKSTARSSRTFGG
jgi:hypothetical protein